MRRTIKNGILWLLDKLPGGNFILFESKPDFSDNTKAVFDEMQRRGLHKKYKMFWWVADKKADLPKFPNTYYLDQKTFWHRQAFRWVSNRAKCQISCNTFLTSSYPSHKAFYLTHGTALKKLNDYYLPEGVTHTVVASESVKEVMARELHGDIRTFYALGYPRNDALQTGKRNLQELLPGAFQKVIVWYPTYRQHKNGIRTAVQNGLPVLKDSETAIRLNEAAKKHQILLVVKPHFAQDISYITQYDLSNLLFINDSFFQEKGISSYEFVGSCDALITDYSSIYFDFLLCDKPAAVIWEDIEDYRKNPGFAMDPEEAMKGSHKIYTLEDFEEFLRSLAAGEDPYREERRENNARMNCSTDGKNARRVTDFIIEQANL